MTKTIVRTVLVAALTCGVLGIAQSVRADDKPAAAKEAAPKAIQVKGVIESVDATAGTVTIKPHKKDPITVTLAANVVIGGEDKKDLKITDLKKGDHVLVEYTDNAGKLVASKIGHVAVEKKAKTSDK